MAIQTATQKNNLATAYGTNAAYGSVYTTAPGATAGTEPTGGSPAFARKALAWSAPSGGAIAATATYDIPSGTTIVGAGVHTAVTAGTYLDGTSVTSQPFSSQGSYVVTYNYAQS